ncbi:hypothetical protein NL676_029343 [Syzygium grande]|nr:hypothetical protein NL676_029343 [Syzygium grande]
MPATSDDNDDLLPLQDKNQVKCQSRRHLCTPSPSISLFLLLFIFFFSVSFHVVHSAFLTVCDTVSSPYPCGDISIQYPFWTVSHNPVHCGYPGLGLNCSSGSRYPILSLPDDTYFVTDINYDNKTLTLIDIDIAGQDCPRARHNLTIGLLPLGYNSADVNLTFFFNCSVPPPLYSPLVAINCLRFGDKQSYVFVDMSPEAAVAFDAELGCKDAVVAAVKGTGVSAANVVEQFAGAMSQGFVLDWGGEGVRRVRALRRAVRVQPDGAGAVLLQRRLDSRGRFGMQRFQRIPAIPRECAPSKCGGEEISYPFRHVGQPDYCGYPGYELGCEGYDLLILSMESMEYQVIHINWRTQILVVARTDLFKEICLETYNETTLDLNLFNYTSNDLNSTLIYGCNSWPTLSSFRFSCPESQSGYFFHGVGLPNPPLGSCSSIVHVPISKSEPLGSRPPLAGDDHGDAISEIINKGFEITWIIDTSQCKNCSDSGGTCGYDWKRKRFNCFCTDGAYSPTCNGTRVPGSFPSSMYAYSHLLCGFQLAKAVQ